MTASACMQYVRVRVIRFFAQNTRVLVKIEKEGATFSAARSQQTKLELPKKIGRGVCSFFSDLDTYSASQIDQVA